MQSFKSQILFPFGSYYFIMIAYCPLKFPLTFFNIHVPSPKGNVKIFRGEINSRAPESLHNGDSE